MKSEKVRSIVKIDIFPEGTFTQEIDYAPGLLAPIRSDATLARETLKVELCAAIDHAILRTVELLNDPHYREIHAGTKPR